MIVLRVRQKGLSMTKTTTGRALLLCCAMSALTALPSASAQTVSDLTVADRAVMATVSVPSGQSADLSIAFENASGLTAETIGLSVAVRPPFDPNVLSRLPATSPGTIAPAAGLPMVVTVAPSAGFSFDGVATVELYTTDLKFAAGSPLRLFKAEDGGAFRDITTMNAGGSYRSRGSTGKFSEFVIVSDLRSSAEVFSVKAARLDGLIADARAQAGDALADALAADLAAARTAAADGRYADAIGAADALADRADTAGAEGVLANRYAPGGPENLAGQLRAEALTLRFTLTQAANGF